MASLSPPSDWVLRWQHLLSPHSTVLDLACGSGRHLRHFAGLGHHVTGVDYNASALASLQGLGELIHANLENHPWPLPNRQFAAVVVTNYLWRPLWPQLLSCLAPGGVLLYETFTLGHAAYGRPTRVEFLLQPGELLQRCHSLQIVAFEQGLIPTPEAERVVQRIAAIRPMPGATAETPPTLCDPAGHS